MEAHPLCTDIMSGDCTVGNSVRIRGTDSAIDAGEAVPIAITSAREK